MSERLLSTVSQLDSGYFTFTSSCPPSPTKSIIIFDPLDSPTSDQEISSPAPLTARTFQSGMDYEHYRTTRKHIDILTQLFHHNAYHLIDEILKNLAEKEFQHCLHVSEQWKFIVDDYLLRQHRQTVKRILFDTDENTSPVTNDKLTSTPMQTITNLTYVKVSIPWNIDTNHAGISPMRSQYHYPPENDIHLAASTLSFRYGYLKYLHGPTVPKRCPICAFVSIVDVNDQHGSLQSHGGEETVTPHRMRGYGFGASLSVEWPY